MGNLYGYIRVSTRDQNEDRQILALKERNRQISLRIKRPPSQCLCIEMAACSSIMI